MSDESLPPPALRLKPRLRPEGGDAPAATPPAEGAPATPPPAATGEAPKIRLRPRIMTPGAEAPAAAAPAAPEAPAAPAPAPAVIPSSGLIGENPPPPSWAATAPSAPPAAPAGEGAPKIRLKPSVPAPAAAAPEGAVVPAVIPAVIPASIPPAPAAAASAPPPAVIPATVPPPAVPAGTAPEGAKFKLKPKVPPLPTVGAPSVIAPGGAPVPGAVVPAPLGAAPPVLGTPVVGGPAVPPISGEAAGKAPPPFPVVAPPKSGTTAPPIPHMSARAEVTDPAEAAASAAPVPFFKKKAVQISGLAALLVFGGGFVAWQQFGAKLLSKPAATPAPAAKQTPPPAAAPAAGAPATAQTGPTPSDTMNNLAKMPAAAINKAQGAVNARNASGQTDVAGALGEDVANRPAIDPKAKAAPPAARTATVSRPVSAGVSATTRLEVGSVEPSTAFSAFVANAKLSSVLPPTRAFVNDKMARTGDTVDANLGIVLDSIDADKRQVIFRDRTGATVARRY